MDPPSGRAGQGSFDNKHSTNVESAIAAPYPHVSMRIEVNKVMLRHRFECSFSMTFLQGHANPQACMGVLCEHGEGVPRCLARAEMWYSRAAAQGAASARNRLEALVAWREAASAATGGDEAAVEARMREETREAVVLRRAEMARVQEGIARREAAAAAAKEAEAAAAATAVAVAAT